MSNNPITATLSPWHGDTSPGLIDVVTLDQTYSQVGVLNRSSSDIWVSIDRYGQPAVTPAVRAPGSYYVGPGAFEVFTCQPVIWVNGQSVPAPLPVVRLTAAQASEYTLTGNP